MMICLPQDVLAITCAPCGIWKEPIGASTLTVAPEPAEADVVCEGNAVGEEAVRLVAGEGDFAVLAVVIPALRAARDRQAVQVVTVMAMKRYGFIGHLSVSLVAADTKKLDGRLAAGIASLSQICDSGRGSGTARYRKADADHRALAVTAANRDLPVVTGDNDTDQGEPDARAGKAARGTASGELIPDLPDLLLRDPGPGVGPFQQ